MVDITPELIQKARALRQLGQQPRPQQSMAPAPGTESGGVQSPYPNWVPDAAKNYIGAMASVAQVPTFGFSDEIAGGISAAGQAIPFLAQQVTGKEIFPNTKAPGQAYQETRDKWRNVADYFRQENPKTTLGIDIGGAVANPTKAAASVGGRIVQGLGEGALYGLGTSSGNQTEQVKDAAKGGLIGGSVATALEVISPKAARIYNAIRGKKIDAAEGEKTLSTALEEAGGTPEEITQVLSSTRTEAANPISTAEQNIAQAKASSDAGIELTEQVPTALMEKLTPDQQQRAALLAEYNVRGSAGDITRDPLQQSVEDAYTMGRKGDRARAVFEDFNVGKQQDFAGAVNDVRSRIGNGREVLERGQGAMRIAESVAKQANAEREVYREAYSKVTNGLEFDSRDINSFINQAYDDFKNIEAMTPKNAPKAFSELSALKDIIKKPATKASPSKPGIYDQFGNIIKTAEKENPHYIDLRLLDNWRSGVGRQSREVNINPQEKMALDKLKDRFDGYMDGLIEDSLNRGDQSLIDQLGKARGLRAEYAKKWQARTPQEAGKRFLEDIIDTSRRTSEPYTGEQILNKMLGAGKIGFAPHAANAVTQIKKIFGQESPEFTDLKLEVVNRLMKPLNESQVTSKTLQNDPAIQTYKTGLNNFLTENPTLAKEVLTSKELQYLKDLGEIGTIAFQKVRSKTNPSGSGYTAFDLFRGYIDKMIPQKLQAFAAPVIQPIEETIAQRAAEKAITPELQATIIKKINKQPSDVISAGLRRRFEVPVTRMAIDSQTQNNNPAQQPQPAQPGFAITPDLIERARQLRAQRGSGTPNSTPTPANQNITAAINQAAQQSGADPSLLTRIARTESGLNPNAKNPYSSASGLYQFTDGTWKQMVGRYGDITGIEEADKNDPRANAVMGALFTRDNQNYLRKNLKRLPTDGETYIAHFLGTGGALRLIRNKDKDIPAYKLFREPAKANKAIFFDGKRPRSTAEVYNLLSNKV